MTDQTQKVSVYQRVLEERESRAVHLYFQAREFFDFCGFVILFAAFTAVFFHYARQPYPSVSYVICLAASGTVSVLSFFRLSWYVFHRLRGWLSRWSVKYGFNLFLKHDWLLSSLTIVVGGASLYGMLHATDNALSTMVLPMLN